MARGPAVKQKGKLEVISRFCLESKLRINWEVISINNECLDLYLA